MAAEGSTAREPGAAELRRRVAELEAENAGLRRARGVAVEIDADRAALRESEARHRLVVESATDYAIFTMDLDRRITGWNVGAERVLGWPEGEILGRLADAVFTPEDRKAGVPEAEARGAVEEGRAEDVRWHLRRDGSRLWANGVMLPLRDEAGGIGGLLKILRDKTAEKRAADDLREKAGFLERVLESSADCIKVLDLDGRLQFLSAGGLSTLEIDDFGTVRGRPWIDLWPADAGEAVRAAVDTARSGGTARFQGFAPTAKGKPRWWDVQVTPIPGEDGRPERLLVISRDVTATRLAEEALRESEARFRNMADHAPVIMWVTDPSGYCTYLNKRWYEFTGQGIEEALGLGWTKATHPDDEALAAETFLAANAARAPFRVEYRLRRTDGAYRWAIDAASPRFGEDGSFLGYVGSVIDIDERREAEQALRASEARLQAMMDQASAGFAQTDLQGRFTFVNDRYCALVGRPRERLLASRMQDLTAAEDLDGNLPLFREVAAGGPSFEIEKRYLRPDGSPVWVRNSVTGVRGADGGVGSVLAVSLDISGQKLAEAASRDANEKLERLNNALEETVAERTAERDRVWRNSRDLLVVVGADGVFRAVSPAWTTILGHETAEVVGRSFLEFVWPDDSDLTRGGLETASSKRDLTDFENRYKHRNGTPRWLSWRTTADGGLVYAYGRDITAEKEQGEALRQAEEQLRQSQKMEAVGQLTGGLAHDFNNLLTGITGSLELLNTRIRQGRIAEVERYTAAAQGAAKRAAALTHRLLAFSRRQTLDPKPTDVNRLVAGMEELIRRTVGPAIAVEAVAAGGLWTTLVDPHQLENALLNLCINARDAMPDGGKLTIETGNKWLDQRAARDRDLPPGQYVTLCASDTGCGMEPDVARRAFDPFFTTKPIGVGTGLGLSMIYGFVRQSGGQARIYSEPGQGAMVCLYLPRHFGAAEDADAAAASAEVPRAERGETVLVVDDEPTVRMLVAEVLEDLGYTAIEAADGAAGLKVLRSDARIDLLVTDVGLPGGMNGRQVADAARALRPALKVLFITGYAENAVLSHGHLDPGMHVLTKPFAMDTLASRIKDLIAGTMQPG